METIVLSKRNCHRADKVRQIAHPEYGEWTFEWRGQKLREGFMHTEYAHLASQPGWGNATVVSDNETEMRLWEVVSWKYDISFEDLWARAVRAYDGTSFSPEVRAATAIREYESLVIEDLKKLPAEEHDEYVAKFREWVGTLFDKHSRILSVMIAGPANFPVRRNENPTTPSTELPKNLVNGGPSMPSGWQSALKPLNLPKRKRPKNGTVSNETSTITCKLVLRLTPARTPTRTEPHSPTRFSAKLNASPTIGKPPSY